MDPTSVEGAEEIPYEIPNILVDLHSPKIGVPVQWWRSVGHSHTAFVVESFIDEAAHAAGKTPMSSDEASGRASPPSRRAETRCGKGGWGRPLPKGRAGHCRARVFWQLDRSGGRSLRSAEGGVRVHRVVCALIVADRESRHYRGSDGVGIVFGLSAALYGAITFQEWAGGAG